MLLPALNRIGCPLSLNEHASWKNRIIWMGDNLYILRGMNSAAVDLICLEPSFNTKANFATHIGSQLIGAAFRDTWTLDNLGSYMAEYPFAEVLEIIAVYREKREPIMNN